MALKIRVDDSKAVKELKEISKISSLKTLNKKERLSVGKAIIKSMKQLIAKGISPIKGKKRFKGYKNPDSGYPSTVKRKHPSKKKRPVNLKLSGAFLKSLLVKNKAKGLLIGFFSSLSKKKEKGHRQRAGGQPSRPIIPSSSEDFSSKTLQDGTKLLKKIVISKIKKV